MKATYLTISPHDPVIARDGRPFGIGQGHRMRSLDWPYPSVLAGSLRTMLGMMSGGKFDANIVKALKQVAFAGPLPLRDGQIYLPVPKDILVREEDSRAFALRPASMRDDEGCNWPSGNLQPAMLPGSVGEDFKPGKISAFWSVDKITEWLINPTGEDFNFPEKGSFDALEVPDKDERIHVKMDRRTGAAEETKLFSTVGLDLFALSKKGGIAGRIEAEGIFEDQIGHIDNFHTFGGERRLSYWKVGEAQSGWDCPTDMLTTLKNSDKIRMVLATPAIFSHGWLPGWLHEKDGSIQGRPPGAPEDLNLKLISACIDRWRPISGWSLEKDSRGPKAIRRLVSAGSVYFFKKEGSGDASSMAEKLWLRSVSDYEQDGQDKRDGFGLALWGIWDFADEKITKEQK